MSLTTRSSVLHSRRTFGRKAFRPSGRASFQIAVALAIPVLTACADRVTSPTSSLSPSASASAIQSSATLASVGWQAQARALVMARSLSPIVGVRVYALLGVSQYGAVVNADEQLDADGGRSQFEARRGAVAGASATMLLSLFTTHADTVALSQRVLDEGNAGPGGVHPFFTRGVAVGRAFGEAMKTWASADGFSRPACTSGPQSTTCWPGAYPLPGDGVWISAVGVPPAGPQFGAMKPYFLTSPAEFHPLPPPVFGSAGVFATDLAEVSSYSLTDASRTAGQLAEAVNLNLNLGSITPLGKWDEMATDFIADRALDEREAAHVFALTNAAAMDATIGCWEAKYTFYYMRPWAANPLMTSFPIGKPNHPSYPSGHSCVSAAAADVLKSFFPEPEHVAALEDLVIRNGMSRIYAGIHYRFDITAGQTLGRAAAATAIAYDRQNGLLAAVR